MYVSCSPEEPELFVTDFKSSTNANCTLLSAAEIWSLCVSRIDTRTKTVVGIIPYKIKLNDRRVHEKLQFSRT